MPAASEVFYLEREDARLTVRIVSDTFSMGKNVVEVRQWPSERTVERVDAGKMRNAKKVAKAIVEAHLADGYAAVDGPWEPPTVAAEPTVSLVEGIEARRTMIDEARAEIAPAFAQNPACLNRLDNHDHDDAWVVEGEARGTHLYVGPGLCLVCFGDLTVDGAINTAEDSTVLVAGSVRCGSAELEGEVAIQGDLNAAEFVYLNSGNDYAACVLGTLRAPVLLERGTATYAAVMDAAVFRTMNSVRDEQREYPKRHVTREAIEATECPERVKRWLEDFVRA
ncbi:MAG: polymer-forming cytoskeletal protein [Myxococcota bacterium]